MCLRETGEGKLGWDPSADSVGTRMVRKQRCVGGVDVMSRAAG